jgi:hypothetical protein
MFGLDVEGRYLNDATFHRVVDLMRSFLSAYHITPHELREAAILAATMHESERIRPLFISTSPFRGLKIDKVFVDEAKDITPAMFGGLIDEPMRTATGSTVDTSKWGEGTVGINPTLTFEAATGRFPSDGTTVTQVDKGSFKCICGLHEHPNRSKHTHTCNDSNWEFYHPKVTQTPQCDEHCHLFHVADSGISLCADCGMSESYYNWAYNNPNRGLGATPPKIASSKKVWPK